MTEALPVPSGHHHTAASASRGRLLAVLLLIGAFLIVEVVGSVLTNSLALLADAGHMLTDAVGVGLALLAIWFGARPATIGKSFGYYRLEILAAAANAVLLFGMAAFILFEALQRLRTPSEVLTGPMLVIAAVGLLVNLVSLRLLHAGSQESLTVRGAYLEVLGDLFGSVAVLVAGVVIMATGWTQADPIASVAIAVLILPRGWRLLSDAIDVLLQATPKGIDMAEVRRAPAASGERGRHPRPARLGPDLGHERRLGARGDGAGRRSGGRAGRDLPLPVR